MRQIPMINQLNNLFIRVFYFNLTICKLFLYDSINPIQSNGSIQSYWSTWYHLHYNEKFIILLMKQIR